MKLKTLIINYCLFCLLLTSTIAHSQDLDQFVTMHYNGVTLDYALSDISSRYGVNFMYSKNKIIVDHRVTVHLNEKPLVVALDKLFFNTQIIYIKIAGQVVLKIDETKEIENETDLLSQVEEENKWNGEFRTGMVIRPYIDAESSKSVLTSSTQQETPEVILEEPIITIYEKDTVMTYLSDDDFFEPIKLKEVPELPKTKITLQESFFIKKKSGRILKGQISLLPTLGTDALLHNENVNNLSFNILWGKNKNLDGLEIGGLVNSIDENVKGVQLAGLGNTVGGEVIGSQLAGGVNFAKGSVTGFQGAILANISLEKSDALQVAGLINYSEKSINMQMGSIANIADNVDHAQVALFNKAATVKGCQIGLINVADTVRGMAIGLLSLVESGYNRIQIAGQRDGLQATLGVKLGTKRFYNIFQTGLRIDNFMRPSGGTPTVDDIPAWGLGYGFGTSVTFNSRFLLNLEATATHIHEETFWTKELNLLNQIHLTFETKLLGRVSSFIGPTLNIMVSKLYNTDTLEYGSRIAGETFVDQTSINNVNTKMWVGISGGFRF